MEQLHERTGGLDVHRDTVSACVGTIGPKGGVVRVKEHFKMTTIELGHLSAWLVERDVDLVAMEATGVYWKPVYYALEGGPFAVWLSNAHHVKNVPGRKTDLSDAAWLADVAAHGMVRPNFVPPPQVRELRELTRYRKTQIEVRVAEIQRMEKVFQDAGIKLTSVASKVLTMSGRAMIEAMIAGQRDPIALAYLAKGTLRPKIPELTDALTGRFADRHAAAVRQILAHIDFITASVEALDIEVAQRLTAQRRTVIDLLLPVPGLERLSIETIIAETGTDMSRFPSAAHLASWAGLSPENHESAGKRRRAGTTHPNQWLRRTMIRSAQARPARRTPTTPLNTDRSPGVAVQTPSSSAHRTAREARLPGRAHPRRLTEPARGLFLPPPTDDGNPGVPQPSIACGHFTPDRTPAVQPDHHELATPTLEDPPDHRRPDQQYHHSRRYDGALHPGHRRMPHWNRLRRGRGRRPTPATPRLPRRM